MLEKYWVEYRDNHGVVWVDKAKTKEELDKIVRNIPPDYKVKAMGNDYNRHLNNPANWKGRKPWSTR